MAKQIELTNTPGFGVGERGPVSTFAHTPTDNSGAVENGTMRTRTLVELPVFNDRKLGACSVPWNGMDSTDIAGVRACNTCTRNVHAIRTLEEFDTAANLGLCVSIAIDPDDETFPWRDVPEDLWDGVCGVAYPPIPERQEEDYP